MTNDELIQHATRFVIGRVVVINLYHDMKDWEQRWQCHSLKEDGYHLDKRIGYNLTRDEAVAMAMREGM